MNLYSHLLFRRGFLLTDSPTLKFKDELTQSVIEEWPVVNFGKYQLYFDHKLPCAILEENNFKIALLGLLLNPFDGLNNKNEIAKKLLVAKQKSEEDFLNYLDELSGRFVVITQTSTLTEIYNDACGTRTVYYDTQSKGTTVASHSTIIADLLGYKQSKTAVDIIKDKEFVGRRYLPGLMSPYDGVRPLSPNTKYQVEKRSIVRIFPRGPVPDGKDPKELAVELAEILKNQSRLLCEKNKVSISMTAGLDSRLTIAAQKEIQGDVDYFTHTNSSNMDAYEEDVKIATKIVGLKKGKYTIYEYSADSNKQQMKDFRVIWEKNVGMSRGSLHLFKMYTDVFPENRIHVRSNIAEIARVFYPNRSEILNAKKLARYYTRSKVGEYPVVLKSFQEFIEVTDFNKDSFFDYEYQDLFYWEHRMPMWHSWIVNESDVAYETFVPYNNRVLLQKMLSASFEDRKSGDLFVNMIEEMWPEILQYPVNKEFM